MSAERFSFRLMGMVLMLFMAVLALNFIWDPEHLGWYDVKLHPFGIVVLIASLRGGRVTGFSAGLLGATLLLGCRFLHEGLPRYWEDILMWRLLDLPVVLIVLGFALGDVRVQLQAQIDALLHDVAGLKDHKGELTLQVEKLEEANMALRERAFGQLSPESFLYRTARRLDTVEAAQVHEGAMDLLQGQMRVSRGVFYMFEGGVFVAKAWRGWEIPPAADSTPKRLEILMRVMEQKESASLRETLTWDSGTRREETDVVLAVPVVGRHEGVRGVITVEDIPFLQLTENNEQSIRMVGDWAAMALDRVEVHTRLKRQAIYDEELGVFTLEHFQSTLSREFVTARRLKQAFLVLESSIAGFASRESENALLIWRAVGQVLQRSLRGTDIVARHAQPGKLWILCTGPNLDATFMADRINRHVAEHLHEGGVSLEHSWTMGPEGHASALELLAEFTKEKTP